MPYGQISDNLKRAVIASEDGSFTNHDGVDWEALEKAWERNAKAEEQAARRAGRAQLAPPGREAPKIVGGSTITQQLAKNLLLSGERTLLRKGQEFVLTFALEKMLSKERILEIYLNNVEWGEGVFGAEAAARHYYRKRAAQLSRLRGRAPGRDAAAAQVLRESAELRLPRQPRLHHRGADARCRAALSSALSSAHACQADEPVPAGAGARAHRRAGALVRLPAQGRTAHLLRQPPEPRGPGDDLGRAAAGTAQHHPTDRGEGLLDRSRRSRMDHHRGVQRDLRRSRAHGRPGPAGALVDALARGDSIILFPEGTRGNAEEPQPFKAGLYNLAHKFPHVVLVPAWIDNIQRVMPKGEVVPVPILCSVTFGAPIRLGKARSAATSWTAPGRP